MPLADPRWCAGFNRPSASVPPYRLLGRRLKAGHQHTLVCRLQPPKRKRSAVSIARSAPKGCTPTYAGVQASAAQAHYSFVSIARLAPKGWTPTCAGVQPSAAQAHAFLPIDCPVGAYRLHTNMRWCAGFSRPSARVPSYRLLSRRLKAAHQHALVCRLQPPKRTRSFLSIARSAPKGCTSTCAGVQASAAQTHAFLPIDCPPGASRLHTHMREHPRTLHVVPGQTYPLKFILRLTLIPDASAHARNQAIYCCSIQP